jgi:hypothetical protein
MLPVEGKAAYPALIWGGALSRDWLQVPSLGKEGLEVKA